MALTIYITPWAKMKLDAYIDAVTTEISGLGKAVVRDKAIYIEDIYLLKQESGGSDTDLDQQAIAEFMMELMEKGEDIASLKVWWHSHANMNVFWSGTDSDTAKKFGNGWMVSVVGNRRGEYKCRLDVYDPIYIFDENALFAIELPTLTKEMKSSIDEEVKDKVKCKTYCCANGYTGHGVQQGITGFVPGGQATKTPEDNGNDDCLYPGFHRNAHGVWERNPTPVAGKVLSGRQIEDLTDEEIEAWKNGYGCW